MTQFNKSIDKIAYSPDGSMLVSCCQDGSVSLHNAHRQHLPTKMMHLEFPPQHVHIAFSPLLNKTQYRMVRTQNEVATNELDDEMSENIDHSNNVMTNREDDDEEQTNSEVVQAYQQAESMFAIMGEYGNNILVYDTESIILKHQIQGGNVLRSFEFNKNGTEMTVITEDLKIKFVQLDKFEGTFIREILTVHRGAINCSDLSLNGGYMLTGGEDNLLKIWDYDAQKTVPYYF